MYRPMSRGGLPKVQSIFFALTFIIYIPVSVLKSNAPLLMLDALLVVALMQTLSLKREGGVRILGGSGLVLMFLALYIFSVFTGLIIDDSGSWSSSIQGVRSLLFGMGFLILSSIWMNSARRVDGFLKVYLLGALFAASYGLRQFVFGLAPFELDRLSMFGSTVAEITMLERTRIPSSFGEPGTFSVVMMSAVLMMLITRVRPILPKVIQHNHFLGFVLLLAGMLMSLVRGPLVALVAGVVFLFVIERRRVSRKIAETLAIAIVGIVLTFALNNVVQSNILGQSDNNLIRGVDKILTSVWTAIPLPTNLESLTWQQQNLRTLSINYRLLAWQDGIAFMLNNPWGGGIGTVTEGSRPMGFSVMDIGWLRFGIELGWLGLFAFLGLLFTVPWVAYRKLRRITDKGTIALGHTLLALWVAYTVALLGLPFLHTEILSATVWTVAGILLNLDVIAKRSTAEDNRIGR